MAARIYYLRVKTNIREKFDRDGKPNGSFTRGDPVACVITEIDKAADTIKYAVAATHPTDRFVKQLGRNIATGRLHSDKATVLQGVPVSGHEILRKVMNSILETTGDSYARARRLADDWLKNANTPKANPFVAGMIQAINVP